MTDYGFLNGGNASREGTTSLYATALRRLLNNLDKLDFDSLDSVPATLVDQLWKEITRSQLDQLRVWQIFAHTHLGQKTFVHTFNAASQCSLHSTFDVVLASASSSMRWLTNITLDDSVSDIDFSKIPKLRNLRNIVIVGTKGSHHSFSDHLLHSWADAAKDTGCLDKLETIFLSGQREITIGSLEHLNSFLSLEIFCAYGCSLTNRDVKGALRKRANALGWSMLQQNEFRKYYDSQIYKVPWTTLVQRYINHRHGIISRDTDDYPVLNLNFGKERKSGIFLDIDHVRCLERVRQDQTYSKAVEKPSEQSPVPRPTTLTGRPTKMRKVKFGKAMAIDEILHAM